MGGIRAHGYTRGRRFDCTSRMTDQLTDKSPADAARHHAFVFPGQGSQYVGMGSALLERSPEAQAIMERADAALGFSISRLIAEGPAEELDLTINAQPAILATSIAYLEALRADARHAGIELRPQLLAGHSAGQYAAAVAADAIDFETAMRLVREHPAGSCRTRHRWRHGRRHRPDRRAGARDRGPGPRAWRDRRRQPQRRARSSCRASSRPGLRPGDEPYGRRPQGGAPASWRGEPLAADATGAGRVRPHPGEESRSATRRRRCSATCTPPSSRPQTACGGGSTPSASSTACSGPTTPSRHMAADGVTELWRSAPGAC